MNYQAVFSGYDRYGQPVDQYGNPYYIPKYPQHTQAPQQPIAPAQTAAPQAVIIPVKSEDEARNYLPDFSGGRQIFIDEGSAHFYTKRLGGDGLPIFETYEKVTTAKPALGSSTAPEASMLFGMAQGFTDKLNDLYAEVKKLREDVLCAESGRHSEYDSAVQSPSAADYGRGENSAKPRRRNADDGAEPNGAAGGTSK